METTFSTELRDAYLRDGFYLHRESVLSEDLLDRAMDGIEDVRNAIYDTGEAPDYRLWNPGDNPLSLCKIEIPQLGNHALREAIASSRLGEIAAAVTGASMVQVWWVQGLYKPGVGDGPVEAVTNVGWHQDQSYWQPWEEGSELFTAWLALSDVNPESGPMVFVPGSHQWGLIPGSNFHGQDQEAIRAGIAIPEGGAWTEVPATLPPGGVSFHDRLVIHGSYPNRTRLPRRSLAIHMRTEKSQIGRTQGFAKYLQRPEICPVIFGEI